MKIAIIGAGISGLTSAQLLINKHDVKVYEKEQTPGGLIRCERVEGSLFHICGGHVFNSKKQNVLNWFWKKFDRDVEFTKALRNSVVDIWGSGKQYLPYPVENYVYQLNKDIQRDIINDWLDLAEEKNFTPSNFSEFLLHRFGKTLYDLYFESYNEKVWRRPLTNVPLDWLEGKLPMPTVEEMFFNNMNHVEERQFVHSSFYYEKNGGSQYVADKLAEGINVQYGVNVDDLNYDGSHWNVCGETFDAVIFCGNIKRLPNMLKGIEISGYSKEIEALEFHGTTSVFCEIDKNPYSWIYQPSRDHQSHRIICTGNFSATNNAKGKMTATVEFTDEISKEDILENLKFVPLHPKYITHNFSKYTYPIQKKDTREMIRNFKNELSKSKFFFTGRFADWEYYNMDVAMDAAIKLIDNYIK